MNLWQKTFQINGLRTSFGILVLSVINLFDIFVKLKSKEVGGKVQEYT